MPTQIDYQTWDGGEGWNCPETLIGYCKESPEEVLKYVLLTHDVYHYKDLYRPIDYNYPNNVMGLIISDFNRDDIQVIKSIKDIDINVAVTKTIRTKKNIINSFEKCKKWHTYSQEDTQQRFNNLFKEVEDIINTL